MRRTLAVASAAVLLALLTGCVPPPPKVPTPEPTVTPVFATEEDALAAAETAYRAYQVVVDQSLTTYDTQQLKDVAVGDALTAALSGVDKFRTAGKRQVGASSVESVRYVQGDPRSGSDLQIYACLNVSQVNVIDASGASLVPAGRTQRFPTITSFELQKPANVLLVSEEEVWSGNNFCD